MLSVRDAAVTHNNFQVVVHSTTTSGSSASHEMRALRLLAASRNSRPPALSAIRRGGMAVNLTPAGSPFTPRETEIMLALLRENAPVPAHEPDATRRCAC